MNDVLERLGVTTFIQVIIACWNEAFILFLQLTLLFGVHYDRKNQKHMKLKIPMPWEIFLFDSCVLIYNLCDILTALLTGITSPFAAACMHCSAFGLHAAGEFHSLFLLYLFKRRIVDILHDRQLSVLYILLCILQLPMIVMLACAPFSDTLYQIRDCHANLETTGCHIWNNFLMLTLIGLGAMLIVHWKLCEPTFRKTMATAVFIPLAGITLSFLTGIRLTNNLSFLAVIIIFLLHMRDKVKIAIRNNNELARTRTLLAESRFSLERSKNQVLMAQIQPHFINNSLMALAARCADYPDIYESITNFSLYLRSHFEALSDVRTIPFEQEMVNIEAYLALAQESYQEKLRVEYEIECDDFFVPALSVQPLVENAVQHGISMFEEGGTVTIAACRRDGAVVIEVRDKGEGGNSLTPQQKKRKGIGIENVRARLHSMSDGELEIIPGENGTTARITITKCEEVNDYDNIVRGRSAADHGTDAADADED